MAEAEGRVVAISRSARRGTPKTNAREARLLPDHGIEGDAHAGPGHRQVSLLAIESIATMRSKGLDVGPGAFAENITTEGIRLLDLRVGQRILVGECELEVTQIGKKCEAPCAIYRRAGDCVMPREGIFARVISGGTIATGCSIRVLERTERSEMKKERGGQQPSGRSLVRTVAGPEGRWSGGCAGPEDARPTGNGPDWASQGLGGHPGRPQP